MQSNIEFYNFHYKQGVCYYSNTFITSDDQKHLDEFPPNNLQY